MEITIIVLIVAILGFFLWRSFNNNKDSQEGPRGSNNPNPNAPTSDKRL